ncbi:hypothetical protein U1Q18_007168 [Sarracenia purpurea var. burkii]
MSYQTALAVVLAEGCVFFLIAAFGLRAKLARFIPKPVRLACVAGIGLFIAFVGLQVHQGVGLMGPDSATLVTVSACASTNPVTGECTGGKMRSPMFWLGSVGFLITLFGLMKEIKGSMIYGILFVAVISWFQGTTVTIFPNTPLGNSNYKAQALCTLAEIGGFLNDKGNIEGEYLAYMVDAGTTVVGAVLGISPVATFVESSAGIREGGRTGLTTVIVGVYFLLSLFFVPLLSSVPPWATGPSLVMVGVVMMKVMVEIDWNNIKEAVPGFVTMLLMPLTYSISNGIIAGIGLYIALELIDYFGGWIKWLIKMRRVVSKEQNQVSATAGIEMV